MVAVVFGELKLLNGQVGRNILSDHSTILDHWEEIHIGKDG